MNCELTDGVTESEKDVEVALNETEDEETDGRLIIVPFAEADDVTFALTVVMLELSEIVVVVFPLIVVVMLSLKVVLLPGAPVMEALGL